jgi:hypothetical protein
VFTARYALSPYIKQTGFVFKGLQEYRYLPAKSGITVAGKEAGLSANAEKMKHLCIS